MLTTIDNTPKDSLILSHLQSVGSITRIEAEALYKVRHVPGSIHRLRGLGHSITSKFSKDNTGQRYVRYILTDPPSPKQRPQWRLI